MRIDSGKSNGVNVFDHKEGSNMQLDKNLIDRIATASAEATVDKLLRVAVPAPSAWGETSSFFGGNAIGRGTNSEFRPPVYAPKPRGRKAHKNLASPDAPFLVIEAAEVFCVPGRQWSGTTASDANGAIRGIAKFEPVLGLVRSSHIIRRLAQSTSKERQRNLLAYFRAFFAELKCCGWWLGPDPTRGIDLATIPLANVRTRVLP